MFYKLLISTLSTVFLLNATSGFAESNFVYSPDRTCSMILTDIEDITFQWDGECSGGTIVGQGVATTFKNGALNAKYIGNFSEKARRFIGIIEFPDGSTQQVELYDDIYLGVVRVTWPDNESYIGFLDENGERNGFGLYTWSDGSSFEGNWSDGVEAGKGTWRSADGKIEKGFFYNGQQYGSGKHILKNGQEYSGYWFGGKLIKKYRDNQ